MSFSLKDTHSSRRCAWCLHLPSQLVQATNLCCRTLRFEVLFFSLPIVPSSSQFCSCTSPLRQRHQIWKASGLSTAAVSTGSSRVPGRVHFREAARASLAARGLAVNNSSSSQARHIRRWCFLLCGCLRLDCWAPLRVQSSWTVSSSWCTTLSVEKVAIRLGLLCRLQLFSLGLCSGLSFFRKH